MLNRVIAISTVATPNDLEAGTQILMVLYKWGVKREMELRYFVIHIDDIDDKCEAYIKKEADDNSVIDVVNCLNLLRVYLICIDGWMRHLFDSLLDFVR